MRPLSISAGGDDIDEWRKEITKIENDIGEADLKANSNDPNERAYWRNRVGSLQSEKLILLNLILKRKRLILERERKKAMQVEEDGLIRLGKIGDNTMLCSVSKY